MERRSKRKCRCCVGGGGGAVDGVQETRDPGLQPTEKTVCRWLMGSGWERHRTTGNHHFWAIAQRSLWAGQVEGNFIDTERKWRMLGTRVLREAEKAEGWEAFRECWSSGWFQGHSASFRFFICSLWQVDGSLCAVEHSGYTWYRSYLASILPPKGKWKTFGPQEVLLFSAYSG